VAFFHFALPLLWYIFKSRGGGVCQRHTWRCYPVDTNLGEFDYSRPISTQRQRSQIPTVGDSPEGPLKNRGNPA
jgi:hypothetical protein